MSFKERSGSYLSRWQWVLITLFVFAFLCRGAFVLTMQEGFYFPDSVNYWAAGVSLLTNGEFGETYRRAPLYPLFLAGIFGLFTPSIFVVRIVEALMGAGLVTLIAIIARRIGGESVGALAGLLWSIYPLGIFIAGLIYPTGVATTLLACAMLCMVRKPDQDLSLRAVVAGGILLGLTALTIPVALVTVVSTALWIIYSQGTGRLFLATCFLCGAALPLVLWTGRNFHVYDRFVIVEPRIVEQLPPIGTAKTDETAKKSDEKVKRILERPRAFALHFIEQFGNFWELYPSRIKMNRAGFREKKHAEDPRIVKETVFSTSWTLLVSLLSVAPMFLFALIGTGVMWFRKTSRHHLLLLCGTILSFAIGYSIFWSKLRYRFPIEPYITILTAYGLTQTWLALRRGLGRKTSLDAKKSQLSMDRLT
jgi:4-amino-4-deoxy-L-arabinose transferase-like glycosyltransferase